MDEEEVVVDLKDSILNSVKKQLGLLPELKDFDDDIIMQINAAIFTLRQIGVGPQDELFTVTDESQTYTDYLGEGNKETPSVKLYLFYKVRLGFDPPENSTVMKSMQDILAEIQWRLNVQVDPYSTFEQGGEIS